MKTSDEAYTSLKSNLEKRLNDTIQVGSVIDIYNKVIADECGDMYQYIEDNKNPYLFTNTSGNDLDSLGYWVNIERQDNETDEHYKYRLKDWVLQSESSNTTAIENSLLNTEYASNIQYIPYTHGSGTGTCYIIPKEYEEETIKLSLEEAHSLLKNVVSPSLYIEYIVPTIRAIAFHCFISISGDETLIKNNIALKIQDYINGIAPGEYMQLGEIIKLGINESGVDYFNIISYTIDGESSSDTKIVQELETKLLFDEITWSEGD